MCTCFRISDNTIDDRIIVCRPYQLTLNIKLKKLNTNWAIKCKTLVTTANTTIVVNKRLIFTYALATFNINVFFLLLSGIKQPPYMDVPISEYLSANSSSSIVTYIVLRYALILSSSQL